MNLLPLLQRFTVLLRDCCKIVFPHVLGFHDLSVTGQNDDESVDSIVSIITSQCVASSF